MATLLNLAACLPIVETVLGIVWVCSWRSAWRGQEGNLSTDDVQERQLGAAVIQAQLTGVLTAGSIIVVGVGAFAALQEPVVGNIAFHLFWSASFGIAAIVIAVYTMGLLPPEVARHNILHSRRVALPSTLSLFFVCLAGGRFIFAVAALTIWQAVIA